MARRRDADDFGLAPAATARSACGAAAGNGDLVVGGGLIVREIVGVLLAPLHAGETFSYWPALTCIGLLGLGTALLRLRTGSLVPPLFMHFVYNLVLVAVSFG